MAAISLWVSGTTVAARVFISAVAVFGCVSLVAFVVVAVAPVRRKCMDFLCSMSAEPV